MKKLLFIMPALCLFIMSACAQTKSIKDFGAKGDGVADDTQAFINGVQGSSVLTIPAGTYNFKGRIDFKNLHNKTIIADNGAVLRNTVDDQGSFEIRLCTDISITGGTWTYVHLPTSNRTGSEHYFSILGCQNVHVTHVHIIGSSETGFSLVSDVNVTIANNEIEKCYRDGIYSHYSANLVYCGNYIHNIKDDAMSIHDYGIPAQRKVIAALGYNQAGSAIVFDNTTRDTYEGFSSVAGAKIFIANNDIQGTVTSGISIFNSPTMFPGSTARANKITISNNTLSHAGDGVTIMGQFHPNSGQLSTGRAAIFVGATDTKNSIVNPTTRLQYITINNNKVLNSGKNGAYLAQIDNLNLFDNFFNDNNTKEDNYTGKTVELKDCTNVAIGKNTINDNRSNANNNYSAYSLDHVHGAMGKWNISSRAVKPNDEANSSMQNVSEQEKDVQVSLENGSIDPTEFKIIRKPFTSAIMADYINIVPPGYLSRKIACNGFIDSDANTLVIIIRNTSRQPIHVTAGGWLVREFYHN